MKTDTVQRTSSKLKIVYILGTGHSGSTLLELILSTAPGTFSVGGFRYLDRYIKGVKDVTHDDVGYLAQESPMWSPIARNAKRYIVSEPKEPTLSFFNRVHILLTGRPTKIPYRYHNQELYKAVQKQAGTVTGQSIRVIIDSSKTLARLIEIHERTDFDVFVIHLIRDVRGVVNSNRKLGKQILSSARYWLTDNLYASAYLKQCVPSEQQLRIHYEDFVMNPNRFLTCINQKSGLQVDTERFLSLINKQESYRFAGNEMRKKAITSLRPDKSWCAELPWMYRVLLGPINRMFK